MNIIDHIEKINKLAAENGLNETFFVAAKEHLEAVAPVLRTSPVQTALFSLLLEHFGSKAVTINEIAKTLNCSKMQLIKYMDDFDVLRKLKLIKAIHIPSFLDEGGFPEYTIPLDVLDCIRKGEEYKYTAYENLSPEDFFDIAGKLIRASRDDEISRDNMLSEIEYLLEHNKNIVFVKKQKEHDLGIGSVIVLLIFICTFIHDDRETIVIDDIKSVLGYRDAVNIDQRFKNQKHKLFVKELVEFSCHDGLADAEQYRLSQKFKDEFLCDFDFKRKSKRLKRFIINTEEITVKKLFYNDKIKSRINELTALLREENFSSIQNRLTESGMRTGFACLFSGPPGTGKTETAYQIARETGRDIMLVDISQTKSMWYGESEKRIKAVFDRYRGVIKGGGLAPVLLFNEADAVLGKRRELSKSRSGPDQTENAIQNIILQEMETLSRGILIATTNMTCNFDKAFERRFLYKIEFDKPDTEAKVSIWQSILPSLAAEDVRVLSRCYDFSGGQIENIARKETVSSILRGKKLALDEIISLCDEELITKKTSQIGFSV